MALDLPKGYEKFDKIFERMALIHGHGSLFTDFMKYSIWQVNAKRDPNEIDYFKERYNEQEHLQLREMFKEMILLINDRVDAHGYYDFPGHYYEYVAHSGHKKGFGQFFTPEHLIEFMVLAQNGTTGQWKKVNDPACGSGRMLLGFHAKYPGNLLFGEDMDYTCCLMTVWNMLIGGAIGEVVHHNSLIPDTYDHGWRINETLYKDHSLSVVEIPKEESYVWTMWDNRKKQNKPEYEAEVEKRKVQSETQQLSLF